MKQRPKSRYHDVGAHQRQRKREEGKKRRGRRIKTQRVDLPNSAQAIDAPIGEEEQNEKQK